MDALDDRLDAARNHIEDNLSLSAALTAVMVRERRARRGRRRYALPAVSIGLATVFAGGAAFALATNWSPWIVSDPDVVISRTWVDQTGERLGYCETRISALDVPTAGATAFNAELAAIDVEASQPDPQAVSEMLAAAGRSADLKFLVPEDRLKFEPSRFTDPQAITGEASDARILQEALAWAVIKEATERALESNPDPNSAILSPHRVTQCAEELP